MATLRGNWPSVLFSVRLKGLMPRPEKILEGHSTLVASKGSRGLSTSERLFGRHGVKLTIKLEVPPEILRELRTEMKHAASPAISHERGFVDGPRAYDKENSRNA